MTTSSEASPAFSVFWVIAGSDAARSTASTARKRSPQLAAFLKRPAFDGPTYVQSPNFFATMIDALQEARKAVSLPTVLTCLHTIRRTR